MKHILGQCTFNFTETAVCINGPRPVNCDSVVTEAMREMWRNCKLKGSTEGHFVRRSSDIRSYTVSKAVNRVTSIPNKLSFM